MSRPFITIFDVQENQEYQREMNDEEYAQYLVDQENEAKIVKELQEKQAELDAARAAVETKLAALGLDMDTVKLLAKLG